MKFYSQTCCKYRQINLLIKTIPSGKTRKLRKDNVRRMN